MFVWPEAITFTNYPSPGEFSSHSQSLSSQVNHPLVPFHLPSTYLVHTRPASPTRQLAANCTRVVPILIFFHVLKANMTRKFTDIRFTDVTFLDIINEGEQSAIFKVIVHGTTCVMKLVNILWILLLILLILSVA